MTQEQAIDSIIEIIKNSDSEDLIDINNGYQDEVGGDCHIYHMDEFNEIMESYSPLDLAFRVFYGGDFNPNHKYFWYNGYGNLCSSDYADDCPYICESEIAEWCVEHDEDFGNWRIRAILYEYNESEEEEEEEK